MNHLLLAPAAILLVLTLAGHVWAAENNWTGFYIGANIGGGFGIASAKTTVSDNGTFFITTDPAQIEDVGSMTLRSSAFTGGGQVGYNYQLSNIVLGVEADFNALNLKATKKGGQVYQSTPSVSFEIRQSVETDWLFTLRPRVGWAVSKLLIYGTGGLAVTRIKYEERFSEQPPFGFADAKTSETNLGWTIGAGGEYRLTSNWTVKGEYLYADFGSVSTNSAVATPVGTTAPFDHSASLRSHIFRLGVNYRFR